MHVHISHFLWIVFICIFIFFKYLKFFFAQFSYNVLLLKKKDLDLQAVCTIHSPNSIWGKNMNMLINVNIVSEVEQCDQMLSSYWNRYLSQHPLFPFSHSFVLLRWRSSHGQNLCLHKRKAQTGLAITNEPAGRPDWGVCVGCQAPPSRICKTGWNGDIEQTEINLWYRIQPKICQTYRAQHSLKIHADGTSYFITAYNSYTYYVLMSDLYLCLFIFTLSHITWFSMAPLCVFGWSSVLIFCKRRHSSANTITNVPIVVGPLHFIQTIK